MCSAMRLPHRGVRHATARRRAAPAPSGWNRRRWVRRGDAGGARGDAASTSSTVMRPPAPVPAHLRRVEAVLRQQTTHRRAQLRRRRRGARLQPPRSARRARCAPWRARVRGADSPRGTCAAGRCARAHPPARSPPARCLTISRSTPVPGAATSTVTLSVSISISGSCSLTASPTALSQRSTCERVPSVCSAGARMSRRSSCDQTLASRGWRAVMRATLGTAASSSTRAVRARNIRHRQPLDRRIEIEERFLGDHGGDLGAEAGGQSVLVHDQAAARLRAPKRAPPRGPTATACADR